MPIESPESIPLPESYVKALESARNNVSLLEAEAGRLTLLRKDQERELIALQGKLAAEKESIVAAQVELRSEEPRLNSSH